MITHDIGPRWKYIQDVILPLYEDTEPGDTPENTDQRGTP